MIPVPSQRRWARPPGSAMRPPASDVARQATHAWLALLSTTRPGCRSVASSTQTTPATSSALRRRRVSPNRSGWPDGPPVGGAQAQAWQDMADRMRPQGPASQRRVGLRALAEDRTLVRRRRRLTTIFSTGAKIAKASRDGRGRAQHGKTACKQRQCRGFQYISAALDWTLTCRLLFSFFPPVSTCRCTSSSSVSVSASASTTAQAPWLGAEHTTTPTGLFTTPAATTTSTRTTTRDRGACLSRCHFHHPIASATFRHHPATGDGASRSREADS